MSKKKGKKKKNISFEKDWRSTIWVSVATTLTIWGIPISIYFILKNYFTNYKIDKNVLTVNTGIIFKKNNTIDLYQIKNISAQNDLFRGGILLITTQDKLKHKLPYIKNTTKILPLIRDVSHSARRKQKVASHEFM